MLMFILALALEQVSTARSDPFHLLRVGFARVAYLDILGSIHRRRISRVYQVRSYIIQGIAATMVRNTHNKSKCVNSRSSLTHFSGSRT